MMGITPTILAQKFQDVLVLKNGDKVKGQIIEQTDESIKIRLYGGNEFTLKLKDVTEITSEKFNKPNRFPHIKQKGYYNTSTISLLARQYRDIEISFLHIHTVHGYRFSPMLGIGLGCGINEGGISIYININGDIQTKGKLTPTYSMNIGREKFLNCSVCPRTHPYYSVAVGLKLPLNEKWNWLFSINRTHDKYPLISRYAVDKYWTLNVGVAF